MLSRELCLIFFLLTLRTGSGLTVHKRVRRQEAAEGNDCGTLELGEGNNTFATPNYPGEYPSLAKCEWTIPGIPSEQVELVITEGRSEECCDILTVYDGDRKLEPLSGVVEEAIAYRSGTGRDLRITFETDEMLHFSGSPAGFEWYRRVFMTVLKVSCDFFSL